MKSRKIKYLLMMLVLNPLYSLQAFEIGVGTHLDHYSYNSERYISLMNEYGFTSFRDGISWNAIEHTKGKMNIPPKNEKVDSVLMKSPSRIIKNSIFVLAYGNKNHTDNGRPKTKEQADQFAKYAKWVATRYKGRIKYYEIWNEWLVHTGVKKGDPIPPNDIYLYLVKVTAKAIKDADPEAIVITGSLNPIYSEQVKWISDLIKEGLSDYVDGISIHPYTYYEQKRSFLISPVEDMKLIDDFEKRINVLSGRKMPIYITEMGYPTSTEVVGGVTPEIAAKYIYEYTSLAKSRSYIKGVWWYDLIDDGNDTKNKEHNFGLFRTDLTPKTSAKVMRELSPELRNENVAIDINDQEGIVINNGDKKMSWESFSPDY